jgi:type IV pilus assembly protein PilE
VSKQRGFTLIELMIVVAVLAIIAAIALPSYLAQVRKSRRSAIEGAMQQIALLQEQFRADCTTYATGFSYTCPTLATLTFPADNFSTTYYTVAVANSANATSYTITATATSAGGQNKDKAYDGSSCSTLTYDYGVTTAGTVTKTSAACWAK